MTSSPRFFAARHHGLEVAVELGAGLCAHQRPGGARDRHRGHALAQRPENGGLGERRHTLAADASPRVEVPERRDHRRAADCPRERVLVDLAEPRARDLEDVRVEAGRVDQLGLQQLAQLRRIVPEPLDRLLEDGHRLGPAVEAEERAAELQPEPGVAQGLVGTQQRFLQVLGRGQDVHALLRQPELGQRVDPRLCRRRLGQRAPQVADRDLGRAANERPVRGHAQRVHHEWVSRRRHQVEVRGHPLGLCAAAREQLRGLPVGEQPLRRLDRLVHSGAHHRVRELDRRRRHAQQLAPRERDRGERGQLAVFEPRERRHVAQLGAVAEHGGRGREAPGLLRQAREPQRNRAGHRFRADLVGAARVLGDRLDALPVQRSHERAHEERVAAGRRVARRHELGLRFAAVLRYDHRVNGRLAERGRTDHQHGRVGHQLGQQLGLDGLLRRAQAQHDQQWQPLEPAAEEGQPAQARRVRPVQVVDHERRRAPGGEVGREPVEPVHDRERDVAPGRSGQLVVPEEPLREAGRAGEHVVALLGGSDASSGSKSWRTTP